MMIFERDIAIDLGTTNIRVFVRGKGIMLREPSIVAVDKYTGRMLKVGQDAQKMLAAHRRTSWPSIQSARASSRTMT